MWYIKELWNCNGNCSFSRQGDGGLGKLWKELTKSHKESWGKQGCKMINRISPSFTNLSWPVPDFFKVDIAPSKEESFQNKMRSLRPMLTVQHPNFTQDSAEHDLMLIKLKHPLKLNGQWRLVILPNSTDDRRGDKCTVSGWGWAWKNFSE